MKVVYISSPYSLGNVEQNVLTQLDTSDVLISLGYCPYTPLLCHFQDMHKSRTYEEWMNIDLEFVKRSDVVLRLPGESKGADKEVALAKELGIPVVYSLTELQSQHQGESSERTKVAD